MRKAEEEAELDRYHDQILATLEESAQLEFPPVLVEKEIDHLLQGADRARAATPAALERYLQRIGKSEEEVRDAVASGRRAESCGAPYYCRRWRKSKI